MRKFLLILGLVALTACHSDKNILNFDETSFDPGEYWEAEKEEGASLKILDAKLLRSEKPLDLEDLIEIALKYNPSIRESYFFTMYKDAQKDMTTGDYFPHISATAENGRSRTSNVQNNKVVTNQFTKVDPRVNLNYLLFDFGARSSKYDMAKYDWEEASLNYNRLIEEVRKEVSDNYWGYLHSLAALRIENQNLVDYEEVLKVAKGKLEAGTIDKGTYLQAYSQLLSTKVELTGKKSEQLIALSKLKASIGLSAEENLWLNEEFPKKFEDASTFSLESLNRDAQRSRADLLALEKQKDMAKAGLRGAISDYFPQINAKASYDRPFYIHSKNPSYGFTALLAVDIPIFSGFESVHNLRAWKDQVQRARSKIQSKKVKISKEVSIAIDSLKKADAERKLSKQLLGASQSSFDISMERFSSGMNTIVDVITAQNSLANARAKLTKSTTDRFVAFTDLKYYVGKEEQ